MRCHIPIEELPGAAVVKIRAAVLEATGGPLTSCELDLAPPGPGEVLVRLKASGVCHSDSERDRRHRPDALPRGARPRGGGRRRGGRGRRRAGRPRRSRRALVGAVVRAVLGVRPRAAASLRGRVARDGRGRAARPHVAPLARRRARLPLLADLVVRRGVRRARALVRPDPEGRAVRDRRARRLRRHDRSRRGLEHGRGSAGRPRRGVRLRRRRAVGGARRGRRGRRAGRGRRRGEAKLAAARELGATAGVLWAGSPEATAEAVREASNGGVDAAIEATGRVEAMLAAFLSTRKRGAAVLIGIPREDAVLSLPALSIPRMERRVLGSIYGSSRPERDFPAILDLYRRGRLPLDRLVSHTLPLEQIERGVRAAAIGRGETRRPRPGRSAMNDLDGRIGDGWGGVKPNGSHVNVVLARRGSPTAAAAICMLAHPIAGAHAGAGLRRRDRAGVRAGLAADADDEQGHRARRLAPDADVGRRAARDRAGRARRRRRRADRGERRPARARRGVGRPGRLRRDRRSRRESGGGAQGDRHLRQRPRLRGGGPHRRARDTITSPFYGGE